MPFYPAGGAFWVCNERGENFEEIARELAMEQKLMQGLAIDDVALPPPGTPKQPVVDETRPPKRTGTDG